VTAIRSRPYAFNSVTGFTLFSSSDAIAQKLETENDRRRTHMPENEIAKKKYDMSETAGKNTSDDPTTVSNRANVSNDSAAMATSGARIFDLSTLDSRRLLSAGAIGILFSGVVYPMAYARLDTLWKGVTFAATLKKSLLEIATVGIFVNSVSISARGWLVGRDADEVAQHTIKEMPRVTLNDARVWLPYNLVAFSFIPIYIRPATTSLMEACWQTYISLCSHNYQEEESLAVDSR